MKHMKQCLCMVCLLAIGSFALTGCGTQNSTSGNNTQESTANSTTQAPNAGNAVGDAIDDAGNAIGDAVDDVADGVADVADDITSGFTNYGDAHDYFMKRIRQAHPDSQYELRNESEALTAYDGKTQGYHFELYDTAKNSEGEKVGDFYLEPKSGKVFQKDASGTYSEYSFTNAN